MFNLKQDLLNSILENIEKKGGSIRPIFNQLLTSKINDPDFVITDELKTQLPERMNSYERFILLECSSIEELENYIITSIIPNITTDNYGNSNPPTTYEEALIHYASKYFNNKGK